MFTCLWRWRLCFILCLEIYTHFMYLRIISHFRYALNEWGEQRNDSCKVKTKTIRSDARSDSKLCDKFEGINNKSWNQIKCVYLELSQCSMHSHDKASSRHKSQVIVFGCFDSVYEIRWLFKKLSTVHTRSIFCSFIFGVAFVVVVVFLFFSDTFLLFCIEWSFVVRGCPVFSLTHSLGSFFYFGIYVIELVHCMCCLLQLWFFSFFFFLVNKQFIKCGTIKLQNDSQSFHEKKKGQQFPLHYCKILRKQMHTNTDDIIESSEKEIFYLSLSKEIKSSEVSFCCYLGLRREGSKNNNNKNQSETTIVVSLFRFSHKFLKRIES